MYLLATEPNGARLEPGPNAMTQAKLHGRYFFDQAVRCTCGFEFLQTQSLLQVVAFRVAMEPSDNCT